MGLPGALIPMGHACTHDDVGGAPGPKRSAPDPQPEHPITAIMRIELHGTGDLEEALLEPQAEPSAPVLPPKDIKPDEEREVEAAVTSSRFATGLSP
ncbi:MAG: hypothetical protein E6H47_08955 [Betaproteobacteria bacterium]|nr:MAG: hypothetical protein E6H47_08955 [Betaproteobacteria bacterium]